MYDNYSVNNLKEFLETAIERHRIYLLKEQGIKPPWSTDMIFQNFFFCNVFRQYDKCSKWIIDHVIPLERWDLIILYRFISTYKIFKEIEDKNIIQDIKKIYDFLEKKYNNKEKIFNGCFIRNPKTNLGYVETYKVPFILINELYSYKEQFIKVIEKNSLEQLVNFLKEFRGIGGFMAYEYACDFEYTDYFNPTDKLTWANMGPGAKRGMSLVKYGHEFKNMRQDEWLRDALSLRKIMERKFFDSFTSDDEQKTIKISIDQITLREVEHWLCEYQKYCKYKEAYYGQRKVKHRKYNAN